MWVQKEEIGRGGGDKRSNWYLIRHGNKKAKGPTCIWLISESYPGTWITKGGEKGKGGVAEREENKVRIMNPDTPKFGVLFPVVRFSSLHVLYKHGIVNRICPKIKQRDSISLPESGNKLASCGEKKNLRRLDFCDFTEPGSIDKRATLGEGTSDCRFRYVRYLKNTFSEGADMIMSPPNMQVGPPLFVTAWTGIRKIREYPIYGNWIPVPPRYQFEVVFLCVSWDWGFINEHKWGVISISRSLDHNLV